MRKITIRYSDSITNRIESYVFSFDPALYKDSTVFKNAIRTIDTGDSYVVEFDNYISKCAHDYSEIGMFGHFGDSKECGYGCKIYLCSKCQLAIGKHNATYGCKITG